MKVLAIFAWIFLVLVLLLAADFLVAAVRVAVKWARQRRADAVKAHLADEQFDLENKEHR